jgi:hypothetical protein
VGYASSLLSSPARRNFAAKLTSIDFPHTCGYARPQAAGIATPEKAALPSGKMGRVYINAKQYFEGITSKVWEFRIGGYQVCEKWLKDRKGRTLGADEIEHYQRTVSALAETRTLMAQIDSLIADHGGWPITHKSVA